MNTRPTLATRFGRSTREMRSEAPLTEDQMRHVAPSVFAEGKHASRSGCYTWTPTIDTREVTSIDSTIHLNRALWRLAVQTAHLASV